MLNHSAHPWSWSFMAGPQSCSLSLDGILMSSSPTFDINSKLVANAGRLAPDLITNGTTDIYHIHFLSHRRNHYFWPRTHTDVHRLFPLYWTAQREKTCQYLSVCVCGQFFVVYVRARPLGRCFFCNFQWLRADFDGNPILQHVFSVSGWHHWMNSVIKIINQNNILNKQPIEPYKDFSAKWSIGHYIWTLPFPAITMIRGKVLT